ncbi:nicotinate phosphoribosyltransferase [Micromonospora sp. 4G57]|uniref:Nicotinate phosphoribosyltransferase n=1 Tax=Micromonospora sicca TaxID=2202420 RepID=A0ABU5J5V7_9ACTN|nr:MULTISPECIES: nicotinate phosphoribosyltransferase [unclassified Micromonospora]MDZ5443525.1 nicotinate phosphoribosyltransferase [Micromonospora sp. 4G57]MDZ5487975.1 nicotinate phosphoribosyltransferase [Micromonospora sp. 4G53]
MTGLRTDLYELRMAASYLRRDMVAPATFSLFVRRLPPRRGFLVAAGLAEALAFLEGFAFDDDELGYLRDVVGLDQPTVAALAGLRFTGDVRAVPEGRVVFADEPLLEVTAPIAEAQLVETGVLNLLTFHTTVASKAARCRLAAGDAELVDFAFRRTHGIEAGAGVARASAIAGFAATSDVEAAWRYGLQPSGTMAHSYVEAFPDERAAFRAFAADFPTNPVFLVDTYDTPAGVRAAVEVITELGLTGPLGVRLDSGDLAALAEQTRAILDGAGLTQAKIVASGSLDEDVIAALVAKGAPIDAYGIGTRMGVSFDAPSLDSAYKLVAFGDRPVLKLSPGKATLPGPKQVFRDPAGASGDVVGLRDEPPPAGREPLLVPVMRGGRRLEPADPAGEVRAARRRFDADLAWLPEGARRLADPTPLTATVSPGLAELRDRVTAQAGRGGAY